MKKINPYVYFFTLGHLATDLAQSAIPALLPYFIVNYGLNYREAASLGFANVLVSSVLQPLFGYYSDRVSKPWFVALGPILAGLSITLIGYSTSYWMIFAAAMLCGLGSALFHPEAALFVNRIGGAQKGQAIATFSVGGNAGFAIGPIIAGICAYTMGIHSLAVFGVVNVLLGSILFWKLPEAKRIATQNIVEAQKVAGRAEATNDWASFRKLFFAILARSFSFALSNTFIPIFWVTVLGATAQEGTRALSALFTIGAFMTYCGGLLADRIGYVRTMRIAFGVLTPAMFLLTHTTDAWIATALLLPVAIGVFMSYSQIVVLGQTFLAKNAGFASGVTLGLSTTLGGLFSPVVGWCADNWGLVNALQILWIVGLIGFFASLSLATSAGMSTKRAK